MKKSYLLTAAAGLLIIAGVIGFVVMSGNKASYVAVDACKALTLEEAKQILGANTTAGSNTAAQSTDDINVSNCSYTNNATTVAEIKNVTVLVRSALNADGATSNETGFDQGMTDDVQMVDGLGDHAYYTPTMGQLNVHNGNDWYIISYGGTNPAENSLSDAEQVADKVVD